MFEILHQKLTLKLSAALLYHRGGVRNYFLYKAPVYLPIEDIKSFGQTGWSVLTWEPWLWNIVSLTEISTVIKSEKALAKTFNDFFVNIVPNRGIDAYNASEVTTSDTNSLTSVIEKYKHHPSITAIKNHMDKIEKPNFSFREITKLLVV